MGKTADLQPHKGRNVAARGITDHVWSVGDPLDAILALGATRIFSQDQDLCEVVQEVAAIAAEQGRSIGVACAFPHGPDATSKRGIDKTDWIRMDQHALIHATTAQGDIRKEVAGLHSSSGWGRWNLDHSTSQSARLPRARW